MTFRTDYVEALCSRARLCERFSLDGGAIEFMVPNDARFFDDEAQDRIGAYVPRWDEAWSAALASGYSADGVRRLLNSLHEATLPNRFGLVDRRFGFVDLPIPILLRVPVRRFNLAEALGLESPRPEASGLSFCSHSARDMTRGEWARALPPHVLIRSVPIDRAGWIPARYFSSLDYDEKGIGTIESRKIIDNAGSVIRVVVEGAWSTVTMDGLHGELSLLARPPCDFHGWGCPKCGGAMHEFRHGQVYSVCDYHKEELEDESPGYVLGVSGGARLLRGPLAEILTMIANLSGPEFIKGMRSSPKDPARIWSSARDFYFEKTGPRADKDRP